MSPDVLTFGEVCGRLRVSDKTLRGILERGELRARKVGAHWRIRSDDLDAYLRGPECPSSSEAISGGTTSPSETASAAAPPRNNVVRLRRSALKRASASGPSWAKHLPNSYRR